MKLRSFSISQISPKDRKINKKQIANQSYRKVHQEIIKRVIYKPERTR